MPTPFADLVGTSVTVAASSGRSAKVAALAGFLRRLEPPEVVPAVGLLVGDPRQGRIGIGWWTISSVHASAAAHASLSVLDVDRALDDVEALTGSGSAAARQRRLGALFEGATEEEQDFLRRLLVGELRQGAAAGVMADAVAKAAGVPLDAVRRATMLGGDLATTAAVALAGGSDALQRVGLQLLRPLQPMLAKGAADVAEAVRAAGPASVEWKLDGARIQVHRDDDAVRVFTRNLNDVTDRVPGVVAATLALPARRLVLDGEIIGLDDELRPQRFQDTMSTLGRDEGDAVQGLQAFFFDVVHADGDDLVDRPLRDRLEVLAAVAGARRVPNLLTADPAEAARFLDDALARGHEGVVVKGLETRYEAGRRGGAWRKVKPVRSLDLVVLAAEWGHGRRRGWLSNLHLGARAVDGDGFVMVGKTFKGLTDELLAWQTAALQARTLTADGFTVHVRPELVVEIALDGVQVSRRYPGGVALRFARVRRYRPDKSAADADTIDAVCALLA